MLRVFLSSTSRDLKGERRELLENLNQILSEVGMENFIPDGRTSHEISIEELRQSDIAIFLISPYYGSLIDECRIKDCKADCPLKDKSGRISYTHCEYKIALAENKPHQAYIVDVDWDIVNELKNKNQDNWFKILDDPNFRDRFSSQEVHHFFEIKENILNFKEEAEQEMCQRIKGTERITSDLADNIVKYYLEKKIDLKDFSGRRSALKELIEKMGESVEIYGVGGIGKTSLVQVGLLIQKLKGKKIVAIGTRQSYLTGSGYKHFKDKCADEIYDAIGGKVTLEDIAIALGIHENLLGKEDSEKINIVLDNINKRSILIFIDDFHLSDDNIRRLVSQANCGIVLASKRKIGLARSEIPLFGIEEEDRNNLINLAAKRFHKELDLAAKEKIKNIAEGHPVSTEILVRNFELINFGELENFKKGLTISNPRHSEELLMREVKDILSKEALILLKRLSVINAELESNINANVIRVLLGSRSDLLLHELIDTGMLTRRKEHENTYIFSYKHIQNIIYEDKKDFHRWALNYYLSKPSALGEGDVNLIESLFHRSKIKPEEGLLIDYLNLFSRIKPSQYGFRRLIDAGEQLKFSFNKNRPAKALILEALANSYALLNKFEESRNAFKETLRIYKELSRHNRIIYKPSLAMTWNNIANLYLDLKKFDESEKAYVEALKILRDLVNRDHKYRPNLAKSLNNIAILYNEIKKFDESEKSYLEALKIQIELADIDSEKFRPDLAMYLNNIAGLYRDLKNFRESAKYYHKALEIQKKLAERTPDKFTSELAMCLYNIAGSYYYLKKYDESEKAYQEALKIRKELADKSPDAFKDDLAKSLHGIAGLYRVLRRYDESRDTYQEALEIQMELATGSPDVFKDDLASTLNDIAGLFILLKKYSESEKAYQEALKIRRQLDAENPDVFKDDLAATLNGIAWLYRNLKRYDESEKAYQEALKIRKELNAENPEVFKDDLAVTLNGIAGLYRNLRRYEESEKAYQEALKIRTELDAENPAVFKDDLAETLNGIAGLYRNLRRYDESEDAYQEALKVRKELDAENPGVFKDDLAETLNDIAELYCDREKYEESENAYQEALRIRKGLAEKNPDIFKFDLEETKKNIERLHLIRLSLVKN